MRRGSTIMYRAERVRLRPPMATVLGSRPVASAAPLPQPMLARSGPIPTRGDWAFEVKWDGFRAIVSTEGAPLRVRSRRGWNMTDLVPELSALPISATLDGELVAFGPDGSPDFPLLCERMLMRRPGNRRDVHDLRPAEPRRRRPDASAVL